MKLFHDNKEYSLLLATNKYRYYIYQDELVLVDVKNGYVNDNAYITEYFLADSFENISKGIGMYGKYDTIDIDIPMDGKAFVKGYYQGVKRSLVDVFKDFVDMDDVMQQLKDME